MAIAVPPPSPADWERFFSKVTYPDGPGGCWIWTGGRFSHGYGYYWYGGKLRRAHRVLYVWMRGEPEARLVLDHTCRNKLCVNPAHLEPVTDRENIRRSPDTYQGQNYRKTHCKNGHPFDDSNTSPRLHHGGLVGRTCKACNRIKAAAYRARKAEA